MEITKKLQEKVEQGYIPFAFGWRENLDLISQHPFGLDIEKIDASLSSSKEFADYFLAADSYSFKEKGLLMPNWVLTDCIVMPSVAMGFAIPAKKISAEIREKVDVKKDYDGLVPISEYILIPSIGKPEEKFYTDITMCSLEPGLAKLSAALALEALDVSRLKSITQYSNDKAVVAHAAFGDLSLDAAVTTTHSIPHDTFVYNLSLGDRKEVFEKMYSEVDNSHLATMLLDPTDTETIKGLQKEIESGKKCTILRPGAIYNDSKEGGYKIPIKLE